MTSATPLVPVILLGGAGTRLWPISRATLPKPLAPLIGSESLLRQTVRRVLACAAPEHLITVGARPHDFLIRRQLAEVAPELGAHRLLEPCGRNTAAAIAFAALYAGERFAPDAVLWVCPSDHLVTEPAALHRAVEQALPVARAGELVTFGITPTRPETGYGYIHAGAPLPGAAGVRRAERFLEKPERQSPRSCSPRAAGTGTAASSCSAPIAFSPSWARTLRPFSRRPSEPMRR